MTNEKLAILRCPSCGRTIEHKLPIDLDDFYRCDDCDNKGDLVALQIVGFKECGKGE